MTERIRAFLLGWRRRSAMIMDYAGAPGWLIHWRCRVPNNWGSMLLSWGEYEDDDDWPEDDDD